MERREFIAGLAGIGGAASLAGWSRSALAQASDRLRHVGVLMSQAPDDLQGAPELAAFLQGLAELGWVEGRNIHIEVRFGATDIARSEALARELVALKPDVLVARTTPITLAFKRETGTIPIVFANVAEPVESGLVPSLARPGGNITGFTNFESAIGGKWLQLLKEADPKIARAAVIYNPQTAPYAGSMLRSVRSAGPIVGAEVIDLPIHNEAEIDTALSAFASAGSGGVIAIPETFTSDRRDLIIAAAARYRLPAVYSTIAAAASGGLMSYAVDSRDNMRRAAGYVDRILKGAKAGDLPVQQPASFEFSINLKTAKALGLDIPATLVARADEVIE
jgi:putative tryptophan/tyrosine transport system substrate-binding protein